MPDPGVHPVPTDDTASYVSRQPVPIVYAEGSPLAMGRQIGQHRREVIHQMLATYRRLLEEESERLKLRDWNEAILHSRKYLPFAEQSVPQYVEELRGIADGAEMDFNDLLVLNCMEALTEDALHAGCTSLAAAPEVTADQSLLVGHNEDWLPDDFDTVYVVHARPAAEPAFLAITYGGLLPNIGFNEHGIAQCCELGLSQRRAHRRAADLRLACGPSRTYAVRSHPRRAQPPPGRGLQPPDRPRQR